MRWLSSCVLLAVMLAILTPALATPGRMIFAGCHPLNAENDGPGLFVADPEGYDAVRLLKSDWVENNPACIADPDWSPDGRKLVLRWDCQLAVLDLVSLLPRWGDWPPGDCNTDCCCPFGQAYNRKPIIIRGCGAFPKWSPAGDRIAFNDGNIAIVNPDGSDYRSLAPGGWDNLTWTADALGIVYTSDQLRGDLYLVTDLDAPSATVVQLTNTVNYTEHGPAIGPDGTKLAFSYGPSVASDYDWSVDPLPKAGVRVVDYPSMGSLLVLTDDPNYHDYVTDWSPDGQYIYFFRESVGTPQEKPVSRTMWRVKADGSAPAEQVPGLADQEHLWGDVTFMRNGVYGTTTYALPGYTNVPVKIGIVDTENLAGLQTVLAFRMYSPLGDLCCPVIQTVDSCGSGAMIDHWAMPDPVIDQALGKVRALAYGANPELDRVSGSGELLELSATLPSDLGSSFSSSSAGFTFTSLQLSDDWGEPIDMAAIPGGIALKPFSYTALSAVPPMVMGDETDPEPFSLTIQARGDVDELLTWCDEEVLLYVEEMTTDEWGRTYPVLYDDCVTPTSVALAGGEWTGDVALSKVVEAGSRLVAKLRDFGGYSNQFNAVGKGDVSGDGSTNVFDVVKVANIAIGRGTWESWQLWAADVNGDGEVNIFDVILCARAAMEEMASSSVGREGMAAAGAAARAASASLTAPSGSVTVTTSTTSTATQTVVSINLSNCAGVAGVQVEVGYDAKKLRSPVTSAGPVVAGQSGWSVLGNDLGGKVKAIAYSPQVTTLPTGQGTVIKITFTKTGRTDGKVSLTSVKLAAANGTEIPSNLGQSGKGKGK